MNIEGKCISDEELRGEYIHDLAVQAVNFACDISSPQYDRLFPNIRTSGLDVDEWHEMIDEMVTLLHAHKASEANR